ncbi:unnamed protein product [Prunus armeniaca]
MGCNINFVLCLQGGGDGCGGGGNNNGSGFVGFWLFICSFLFVMIASTPCELGV